MFLCIPNLLSESHLTHLARLFADQQFVDGRATAGLAGKSVKYNLQGSGNSPTYSEMRTVVMDGVNANRRFSLVAMPRFVLPIRFARYTEGGV